MAQSGAAKQQLKKKVPNIKSKTLAKIIKDIILRFQLPLQLCHGQCFDVTRNMLGKRSVVAIQIYKEQPKAHYIHCHCHLLHFVTRSSEMLSDVMDTTGEIFVLIKASPKHEKFQENLKEQIKNSEKTTPNKIAKFLS